MDREFNDKLGEVYNIINQGKKHLISHMWLVDRDALNDALQQLREAVPSAIQDANNINASRNRILGDAKRFSDSTLAEAQQRARTMQQEAEARARQMMEEAEQAAARIRRETDAQVQAILEDTERKVQAMVADTEVMHRAEVRAEEIIEEAIVRGNGIYHEALDKTEEILDAAEKLFGERHAELRHYRGELNQMR